MALVGVELETLVFEPDAQHLLDFIRAVKCKYPDSRTMDIP